MKTYSDFLTETKGMNRFFKENWIHKHYGHTVGFIANVINTRGYRNPTAKVNMVAALAAENRITTASFTLDYVLVDGTAVQLGTLENAVEWVTDAEGNKTLKPEAEIFF